MPKSPAPPVISLIANREKFPLNPITNLKITVIVTYAPARNNPYMKYSKGIYLTSV
tara:strand:- start:1034 stop:1201 length:168 start_codon:yes stop_codon:yes gene_type:complete